MANHSVKLKKVSSGLMLENTDLEHDKLVMKGLYWP